MTLNLDAADFSEPGLIEVDFNNDGTVDLSREVESAGTYDFISTALADGERTIAGKLTPGGGSPIDGSVQVTIDTKGPQVLRGISVERTQVQQRTIVFSEGIDSATLSEGDFALTGPGISGASPVLGVSGATNVLTVTLNPVVAPGEYALLVGPQIADLAGNLMDGDGDGTSGELTDDSVRDGFTVLDNPTWLTSDTSIGTSDTAYDGQDVVVDHTTLTVTGTHTFHSLWVIKQGLVTHATGDVAGMNLSLTDVLVVDTGSSIAANGRGFAANAGPGAGQVVSGGAGAGGGYGGRGWRRQVWVEHRGGSLWIDRSTRGSRQWRRWRGSIQHCRRCRWRRHSAKCRGNSPDRWQPHCGWPRRSRQG